MSKSKKKNITHEQRNMNAAIAALHDAFNFIEGHYSGIPPCCVENFCCGETYSSLKNFLEQRLEEDLLKKLKKYNYVPCFDCLQKGNRVDLKLNGTSDVGTMIFAIIEMLNNKEKQNAPRSRKKSVR